MALTGPFISYPSIRRGNYQLKVSVYNKSQFLIVANHLLDETKFVVRHFSNELEAAIFIEYIIEKDIYGH